MASPNRDTMNPGGGKLLDSDDAVVDLTALVKALQAAIDGAGLPVSGDHTTTGLGDGVKTVASAGTDEALVASATPAKWIIVQAQTDNTDYVAVGATGVDATEATGTGILLNPGEKITLAIDDVADVFVDALVSGEGVRFAYGT